MNQLRKFRLGKKWIRTIKRHTILELQLQTGVSILKFQFSGTYHQLLFVTAKCVLLVD